jgi:hypothetical protein
LASFRGVGGCLSPKLPPAPHKQCRTAAAPRHRRPGDYRRDIRHTRWQAARACAHMARAPTTSTSSRLRDRWSADQPLRLWRLRHNTAPNDDDALLLADGVRACAALTSHTTSADLHGWCGRFLSWRARLRTHVTLTTVATVHRRWIGRIPR